MENFSEKKKRGRPPVFAPEFTKHLRNFFPEASPRSLINQAYAAKARIWLGDDERFQWIFEADHRGRLKRQSLEYELGRFPTAEDATEAALWLCEHKPTVKDGMTVIRRWRLSLEGKEQQLEGDPIQLANELIDTVNAYLKRYPKTSHETILEAMQECLGVLNQNPID